LITLVGDSKDYKGEGKSSKADEFESKDTIRRDHSTTSITGLTHQTSVSPVITRVQFIEAIVCACVLKGELEELERRRLNPEDEYEEQTMSDLEEERPRVRNRNAKWIT
jgi:hypothetical protein